MKSTASRSVVSAESTTMLVRWVMISQASLSPSWKILVIISVSPASRTPCSWPSFTMDIISSSVTFSSSAVISTPKALSTSHAIALISLVSGSRRAATNSTMGIMR